MSETGDSNKKTDTFLVAVVSLLEALGFESTRRAS